MARQPQAAERPVGPTRSWIIQGRGSVSGSLRVPGDKSISHRAALLGGLAHGVTEIHGFLRGADCLATLEALTALGVEVVETPAGGVRIAGQGPEGLREPTQVLEAGNSGTTLRLLAGVLAGRPFLSLLTGDGSLCRRPMRRIVDPLTAMGATILGRADGQFPPLAIRGGGLSGRSWRSPVASAQVKSAILLAGLQAAGETTVLEPGLSRDHTERMLSAFGAALERVEGGVRLRGGARLRAAEIRIPGDLSSAAFFLVAAAIRPGAELLVEGVGVNPTRTGILGVLERMGARVRRGQERVSGGEPVADLAVQGGRLGGVRVDPAEIPGLVDEIPALAVAAALAEGETVVAGAGELRVKEVDRLAALEGELGKLGAAIRVEGESLRIQGGRPLRGAPVSSRGDHRMAMSLAVAALAAAGETRIHDVGCVETSFPGFLEQLVAAGADARVVDEGGESAHPPGGGA